MAKFLGFSTLGLDLEHNQDLKEKVLEMCKREKMRCIFRVNINELERLKAHKEDHLVTAENVNEARPYNVPFFILEAGKKINEVYMVKEFCERKSIISFAVEFDFAFLRLHNDFFFANYVRGLTRLMNICRRRHIPTLFSSGASSPNELVSPRTLYGFYKILHGNLTRKEILYDIPDREIVKRLDLVPKIFGRSE